MITENTAAAVDAVPSSVEVAEHSARQEAKTVLTAITTIAKGKLGADVRASTIQPLKERLRDLVAEIGVPIARGNTLYLVHGGELIEVALDPKVLVRL